MSLKGADVNEEQKRRRDEARHVLSMPGLADRHAYLVDVLKTRGESAARMLQLDILKERSLQRSAE